ncbi:hypothetical protein V1511DRAFT_508364 [Dipodascopsis uninucleata]
MSELKNSAASNADLMVGHTYQQRPSLDKHYHCEQLQQQVQNQQQIYPHINESYQKKNLKQAARFAHVEKVDLHRGLSNLNLSSESDSDSSLEEDEAINDDGRPANNNKNEQNINADKGYSSDSTESAADFNLSYSKSDISVKDMVKDPVSTPKPSIKYVENARYEKLSVRDIVPKSFEEYYPEILFRKFPRRVDDPVVLDIMNSTAEKFGLPNYTSLHRPSFTQRDLVDWIKNDIRSLCFVTSIEQTWNAKLDAFLDDDENESENQFNEYISKTCYDLKERGFQILVLPLDSDYDTIIDILVSSNIYAEFKFSHNFRYHQAKDALDTCLLLKGDRGDRQRRRRPFRSKMEWRRIIDNYLLALGIEAQARVDFQKVITLQAKSNYRKSNLLKRVLLSRASAVAGFSESRKALQRIISSSSSGATIAEKVISSDSSTKFARPSFRSSGSFKFRRFSSSPSSSALSSSSASTVPIVHSPLTQAPLTADPSTLSASNMSATATSFITRTTNLFKANSSQKAAENQQEKPYCQINNDDSRYYDQNPYYSPTGIDPTGLVSVHEQRVIWRDVQLSIFKRLGLNWIPTELDI